MEAAVATIIFFPILASPLFFLVRWRNRGLISSAIAAICLAAVIFIYGHFQDHGPQIATIPWAPTLGLNFSFLIDGLSLFFAFLVTGMGVLVSFYANYYMDPDDPGLGRFYCCLNLFMGVMLGAVLSNNLLIMFIFWELTGITSFLLIGYHYEKTEAVAAARSALLITALTSLGLLVGILLIDIASGSLLWSTIVEEGLQTHNPQFYTAAIIVCFLIGIFGKSAQFPFHFWLPEAMQAPTPVSAYLHAATMVKLGIYLTARMYSLFVESPLWFPLVTSVCFLTMLIGAALSLMANDIKKILAYATISQLGFFIGFYGMGDIEGVHYDFVHILNHALYKGSLFMLAGIVIHATGIQNINYLGELWKKMPLTALTFLVACAAMAGLPGTTGFLSKELILYDVVLLGRAHHSGIIILGVLFAASIFKAAFSLRLFYHIFVRKAVKDVTIFHPPSLAVQIPPLLLSSCAFFFGLMPHGLENLIQSFYVSGLHTAEPRELVLWHGWTVEIALSFSIICFGTLLFLVAERFQLWTQKRFAISFASVFDQCLAFIQTAGSKITLFLHPDKLSTLPTVIFLFFSTAVIVLCGMKIAAPAMPNLLSITITIFFGGCAILLMIASTQLKQLIALSLTGFFLTLFFAINNAPDLALTQLFVEVVMLFILLALCTSLPPQIINERPTFLRFFTALLFGAAGICATLSMDTAAAKSLKAYFLENSLSAAQAANVVNGILTDFRGLDTLGEAMVIGIFAIAVAGIFFTRQQMAQSHIPSVILQWTIPYIALAANVFAIYLLLRGQNFPGGGFAAGLTSGISFLLINIADLSSQRYLKLFRKIRPIKVCTSGLLICTLAAAYPLLRGEPLLTYAAIPMGHLIFEIGIFLTVLGMSLSVIIQMRSVRYGEGGL
ncbi:MAG: DUF4040 domain-containing protein [Chlamydiales bacterium]|nr:DUF4040 domain-containing protein [Chlamydiales bacterium]